MIEFKCGQCGKAFRVSQSYAGKKIKCKKCNQITTIPLKQAEEAFSTDVTESSENFMQQNRDVFEALLKQEREAPAIEEER